MFRKSNQHPADRALTGIFVRLIGCAYLIYIIVKLIVAPAEDKPQPWLTALILVVLIGLSAVVIGMTIHEFITGLKTGRYKRSSYPSAFDSGEDAAGSSEPGGDSENLLPDDEAAPSGEDESVDDDDDYDDDDDDYEYEDDDDADADGGGTGGDSDGADEDGAPDGE